MNLLNIFRKRDEPVVPTEELVNDVLLKAMLKGEKIDKEKALSLPAVSSAVDRICNTVAMIPIKLYRETIDETTGKKKVEEVKNDPRTKMLNVETGDTLDAFQTKKAWVQDYLLDKGGYLFIEKSKNKFKSLRYVDATNVTINTNFDPIFKDITFIFIVRHITFISHKNFIAQIFAYSDIRLCFSCFLVISPIFSNLCIFVNQ